MAALQAPQAGDLAVMGGEELRERKQVVDQRLHRAGPQHAGADLDIAQQHRPDRFGHLHLGESFLQGPRPGTSPRRCLVDAGLEQQLTQAGQPGPVGAQRGPGQLHRLAQLLVEIRDHVLAELGDGAAVPGQQHCETLTEHGVDPAGGPSQPQSGVPCGGEVLGVAGFDDGAQSGEVLGSGELQIQSEPAGADQEHQQRPGAGASQLGDPVRSRQVHPGAQIQMGGHEGSGQPVSQCPVAAAQTLAVLDIGGHPVVVGAGCRPSDRRTHRAPCCVARAAAYSAARCSVDRCTYRLVVSGLA